MYKSGVFFFWGGHWEMSSSLAWFWFFGLYWLHNAKFGRLTLGKIVVTRCQILKQKCTKFDFSSGSAEFGELTALPRPIVGFEGT